MSQKRLKFYVWPVLLLSTSLSPYLLGAGVDIAKDHDRATSEMATVSWQSPAKLHHMVGKEQGDFTFGSEGIEFRSEKGRTLKLPFLEVQTFLLSPHRLVIETYQNRERHLPGMKRYRFDLDQAVPPPIAAELARGVQRPSQNAVPYADSQAIAIPAHHRTGRGGTNGVLRLRDGGIDYVTEAAGDSRSWRWADLQTLSDPDPNHLLIFGYRDTYTFDLKEALPQSLYYRLVDALDSQSVADSGERLAVQTPTTSEKAWSGSSK